MSPKDILDVADALIAGVHEAEWRAAVSRAYFAAFHAARHLLEQCGFTVPRGEQAHGYLWLRLSNSGHPDVESAGYNLRPLRTTRNLADYDLDRPLDHAAATKEVMSAGDIIQILEMVPATSTVLTQITDAIKVYERDVLRQLTWHP